MIIRPFLTELKARKAKYGFKSDHVGLETIPSLGRLLERLDEVFQKDEYRTELAGMHQNDFRVYTDLEEIADWIRNTWTIKKDE